MLHALKTAVKNLGRASGWPKVRREHLKQNPACAACGTTKKLEVHHVIPVSHDPSRELDVLNLITLCEHRECHLRIGHSFAWQAANPHCREDARQQMERIAGRVEKQKTSPPGAN